MMSDPIESNTSQAKQSSEPASTEPVWTYRGYHLRASEFTTAMVHFFRAEVHRANLWRQRLDTTTNWAVVATGAAISFSFSEPQGHSGVILLNMLLITMFLWIEARRYRYYELWSSRVRLMETDFFASMLVPPFSPSPDWAETLAEHLLQPHFSISILEAVGRRLRRNYWWLFIVLMLAWLGKLYLQPIVASSLPVVYARAAFGPVPGGWVIATVFGYVAGMLLLGILTVGLHEASGEVLPRFGVANQEPPVAEKRRWNAWFRQSSRRRQLMALIITDQGPRVAERILQAMQRGVTGLPGKGMYTGSEHTVLLCALTVTEVQHLKALVNQEDPNAFVIVTPAQEVLGKGFNPLQSQDR
jgi:uncharacterized membrane protein